MDARPQRRAAPIRRAPAGRPRPAGGSDRWRRPTASNCTGPIEGRFAEVLTPAALAFVAALERELGRDPHGAPPPPRRAPGGVRRGRAAGLPARDPRDSRAGLDGRARAQGSRAPLGRAHGPRRAEDGHQRAQLRRRRLHGGLRGRQHAGLAQHGPGPGEPGRRGRADDRAPEPGRPRLPPERASSRPCSSARAAGTSSSATSGSTAPPCRAASSTSASTSSTTAAGCSSAAAGPYFYLPKLESHLEARLWNDAFVLAEDRLGLPRGAIRATVLVETIPAAFEMDEILWELRDHSGGLNAGRWDYMFSLIKKFRDAARVRAAGPGAGHDDGAVHAGLHRAPRQDLPPAGRPRARRHGGLHPEPPRSAGHRGGAGARPGGQGPRVRGRVRRHVGGPPGSRARRPGALRPASRGPPAPARARSAPRWRRTRGRCSTSACRAGR